MKIAREQVMDVPADRVWQVLAHDFAKISEWFSGVAHSQPKLDVEVPEGAKVGGRICKVPGLGEIQERFTSYDESNKTMAFEVSGMPFFVRAASNSMVVATVDGSRSRVSLEAVTEVVPVIGWIPLIPMRIQLNRMFSMFLEELKHFVEKGDIHPRKKEKTPAAQ
jgi:hypothetical protein